MIDFCIPLACYLGFQDIYLLGCDYDWHIETAKDFAASYFYDIQKDDRKLHESPLHARETGAPEYVALIMQAFPVVKQALESTRHRIYNAGYGGRLDIFPRVDYEGLF